VLHGRTELAGFGHPLAGCDDGLGSSHRGPGDARELSSIIELARQIGDPEVDEPSRAGIGREQCARDRSRQQLGLKIGVGLLQQLDCLIDERLVHTLILTRECDKNRSERRSRQKFRE
jgi:hypothetical protein